ncbi:hypothetical protein [Flavisolibacter ginsenosidimutans]|uniref:DUF5602 domain-containing protein n=1 Tax=Flavisolibacter ginsenosidimutans TaxID=661481 RepID=A0A5B8UJF2_9BACT|nr:hypothetical protein [Flavisolibacter ginsenosidimutans]QEC56190.1 hypothetical protein FSB75_09910 [Flavisolibacter ginsenosidimutans]
MKKIFLFAAVSLAAFSSCKKDHENKPAEKIFKGDAQTFQHGKAWTWYEADDNNNPVRIAIAMDDASMASLDTLTPGAPGHHHENSLSLKLHPKATGGTPFTHVLLDWNPAGHEPAGVYDKPHFDFHFYIQPEAERIAIPTYDLAQAKFDNAPAQGYMPPTYINPGGGVPQMGAHWLDVTTPEVNGQPFTQTFLMGSYDGKVTFWEPMITRKFVEANPSFERAIPQPTKYQKAGWYPTKMRIAKQDGTTNIILEGFVQRQAS